MLNINRHSANQLRIAALEFIDHHALEVAGTLYSEVLMFLLLFFFTFYLESSGWQQMLISHPTLIAEAYRSLASHQPQILSGAPRAKKARLVSSSSVGGGGTSSPAAPIAALNVVHNQQRNVNQQGNSSNNTT